MAHPAFTVRGETRGRGFSFVEVVVVMAMMAVLATISFAGIRSTLPIWRLNAASRMLRGDLISAKTRAEKDMRQIRVRFTTEGYVIEEGNARAASTTWLQTNPGGGQVYARNLSEEYDGVQFVMAETDSPIVFLPSGTIDPNGGNLRVVIANSNGKERTIGISMAGRIRIMN